MSFFQPKCITKLKKFYRHLVMRGKSPQGFEKGVEVGGDILCIPGKIVGGTVGAAAGAVKGVFEGIFDR